MRSTATRQRGVCGSHSFRKAPLSNKFEYRWNVHHHAEECETFGKDFSAPFGAVLHQALEGLSSIAMDHEVLAGSPRIANTRIPVYMVLDAVQHSGSLEGALESYPDLSIEQVKDALSFAGAVLEQPVEHEP